MDPFTIELFTKAHAASSKAWISSLDPFVLPPISQLVVSYGTGPVDVDILERILFYDHFPAVKYWPGIDWDDLKQLLGPDYHWPFLYSGDWDWNHCLLFGAESFRYPPEGFCSRPLCLMNGRSCACGPERQLPLRHVGQYVMHDGRYVYGASFVHRLEAALVRSSII
jgi:hypothetical protein